MHPIIQAYFDPLTGTISYVVYEKEGSLCAIIDPVLDYDLACDQISTHTADHILAFVRAQGLSVAWILETHIHADHLTAASYIKSKVGGQIAISRHVTTVQNAFQKKWSLSASFLADGSQFDHLFQDGEHFKIGGLSAQAWAVPGHTPSCMAYCIGDAIFVGDTLFMPDIGTARCDFPGGDASVLYQSIQKILSLPAHTRLFVCHDYPPANRQAQWETTVAQQRAENIHIRDGVSQAQFVAMRTQRDATLAQPRLMRQALYANMSAGRFPS